MSQRQGSNIQRQQIMPQNQYGQSNQQKSYQEAQQIYYAQPPAIQPYGAYQRTNALAQDERNKFQVQNYNQLQLQNQNQNLQNQKAQFQAANIQQNQYQQSQGTYNGSNQYNQPNQYFPNQINQVQSQQQDINIIHFPNINKQNQIQDRSDSQKRFDRPKRDHSKRDNNPQQQANQNKNQAQFQEQYQALNNNFIDNNQKGQILKKLSEKGLTANKNNNQQFVINNNKISNLKNANLQLFTTNNLKINKDQISASQSQLKNNSLTQENTNSFNQDITNYTNTIPQVNQINFQKSNVSQPNSNYTVQENPQNSIQINKTINSNMMNQQTDFIQNAQPFQNNQLLQYQNYIQQPQQNFLNYQDSQINNFYQTSQLQQQQQQQQQLQNLMQFRNLPIQTELVKKKEQAQVSELDQTRQYDQLAQNNNLSVIQEQPFSEISQPQNSENLNQNQFNQIFPSQQQTNSQIFIANQIDQPTQNQQNQIFAPQVNSNSINQQSNDYNYQTQSTQLQNSAKKCQNDFDQNQCQIAQQQNSNIQQKFNQAMMQNEKQRNEEQNQPKDLSYKNQDSLNDQVINTVENNNQIYMQQDKKQPITDPNGIIIEQASNSKNDIKQETQNQSQQKECFLFLTKQQINYEQSIIEQLAEQLISKETQQKIQQLQVEVDSKDLCQIYNFDALKTAIDFSVQEFKSIINSEFKEISNLKLFDSKKILDQYQMPQDIYDSCLDELKLIHSGILAELLGSNREEYIFETKINKEICKNMLLQYLHHAQMSEIIYCVFFNRNAIQELTYDKLIQINTNEQSLKQRKKYENDNISQSFNECLDQIKKEIIENIHTRIFQSNSQDSLQVQKDVFKDKKDTLIKLINEYWKLVSIKHANQIELFSVVIIYKKIQIIKEDLNQLLEYSQDSLNSFVNEILFKQNNIKINVCPIETQISENFEVYVRNDTNNIIQKLKKKQDQLFEIAYCQCEQAQIKNYYNNPRALDIFKYLTALENYTNMLDKANVDNLKQLYEKESFINLFQSVLYHNQDWIQINNINNPSIFIFLIRDILKRVLKKIDEVQINLHSKYIQIKEKKKDYIEEYFNQNLNIPFFEVKFIPKPPNNIEYNTIYVLIYKQLDFQEFTFKIRNYHEVFQYKDKNSFSPSNLKEEMIRVIKEFDSERKDIPFYFFKLEQFHKCGILAMYMQEKYQMISSYIEKKKDKGMASYLAIGKQSKFIPFIQKMSFSSYQKTIQYTYELTLDFIENLKKGIFNQQVTNQKVLRKQQSEFKNQTLNLSYLSDQLMVFEDQSKNPQTIVFKDQYQKICAIFIQTKIESFQKQVVKNIQVVYRVIFEYNFQKIIFFSLFNDIFKENSNLTIQFYLFFVEQILNLSIQFKDAIQFDEVCLQYLISSIKDQQQQKQLKAYQKQEFSLSQQQQQQQFDDKKRNYNQQNNTYQSKEVEKNQAYNKKDQQEIIDQKNKQQQNNQDTLKKSILAYGHLLDFPQQQQQQIQKELVEDEKKYCLENFLGQIQEKSFQKLFKNQKKKFNTDYLKSFGYIDQISDLRSINDISFKINSQKEKSCLYIIGNLQKQFQILVYQNQKYYFFYENDNPRLPQIVQIENQIKIKQGLQSQLFEYDQQIMILYILIWLQDTQKGNITQQMFDNNINQNKFELHLKYIWIQQQQIEKYQFLENKYSAIHKFDQQVIDQIKDNLNKAKIFLLETSNTQNQIPLLIVGKQTKSYLDIVFIYDQKNNYLNQIVKQIESNFQLYIFRSIDLKFKNAQQQRLLINLSLEKYLILQKNEQNYPINILKYYFEEYTKDICFPFQFIEEKN